MLSRSN